MALDEFSILLDNPDDVILAGQSVSGSLCITVVDKPKTFKGIFIQCKGYAYVGLTFTNSEEHDETPGYPVYQPGSKAVFKPGHVHPVSRDALVTATEDFFKFALPILQAPSGQVSLAVGKHVYPFSFFLPDLIPSSYEGTYGHIRYVLKATMQRPWNSNTICSIGFAVINPVDLNLDPVARLPASETKSKTIYCCCCASGPITARAWINQSGFVPGETLYFNAEVKNESGKTMRSSTFKLTERVSFHAKGDHDGIVRIIKEINRGPFGPLDHWNMVPILIPSLTPSGPPYCNIIKISYQIEFSVDPGFFSRDLKLEPIKILIGNLPVRPTEDDGTPPIPNVSESEKIEEGTNDDPPFHDATSCEGSSCV